MMEMEASGRKWQSAEHIVIPYVAYGIERNYLPDFLVDDKHMVEIKPLQRMNEVRVVAKQKAAIAYCEQNDLTYEIKDIVPDIEKIYDAYANGAVTFTDKYKPKFLKRYRSDKASFV